MIKDKVEPLLPVIEELCNGKQCYNLFGFVKYNADLMRPVFVGDDSFVWKYDDLLKTLKPQFSEEGGNKKPLEVTTYKALLDIIEYCFYAGEFIILTLRCVGF